MRVLAASIYSLDPARAVERASAALDVGYERVVLDAPIGERSWSALRERLPPEAVAAVRLFVPYPRWLRDPRRSPFHLGAVEPGDRAEIERQARASLQSADRLGVRVVRVPLAPIDPAGRLGEPAGGGSAPAGPRRGPGRELDAYRGLVYRLASEAERLGLRLALTVSGQPDRAPGPYELETVAQDLAGAPISAWVDGVHFPYGEWLARDPASGACWNAAGRLLPLEAASVPVPPGVLGEETRPATPLESPEAPSALKAFPCWVLRLPASALPEGLAPALEALEALGAPPDGGDALPPFGV